ncbi:hypothetical protein ABB37_01901 [Leptomonas pyrrhocoris]|uniref:Uncharacterized protein n=1 Tax=Leptomonas pyrrhocoris TaxID=157538 RepID=A0A0M9G6T4_LEPPY|nr:hypothetical protein ABB37_01901 [Leptomonas pyrrhocoris]KPA83633.1 hypothetical protein ABB37_01901 [Leptomonas pyrrhocoris]|eukprot:XP_015662072.1 hypothetical protein ABB37_01901 [Leptomonas pyrrhocoris]
MSHMTADLEYFKCDMCGVYMHRDIFCDHRRDCHGRDSTVLKRGECAKLSDALSRETRELLLAREAEAGAPTRPIDAPILQRSSNGNGNSEAMAADASAGAGQRCREADRVVGEKCEFGSCDQASEAATATEAAATLSKAPSSSPSVSRNGDPVKISASVSVAELERRQEARTRRAVSDRYQATLDAKISALLTEEKKSALLSFLNS